MNWHKALVSVCLAACLAGPLPAQAQVRPVTAEELGEAVGACIAATGAPGALEAELVSRGWSQGAYSADGKQIEAPVPTYGKEGNSALILVGQVETDDRQACIVLARLPSTSAYHPSVEELSRIIGQPVRREDNDYFWQLDGVVAQLVPTGNREKPALRFAVMATEGSNR